MRKKSVGVEIRVEVGVGSAVTGSVVALKHVLGGGGLPALA